jgi:hypothetical protein
MPINPISLSTFTNIPFNNVVVSGDTIAPSDNGTFTFASTGSGYSFNTSTGVVTNAGTVTIGANTASGALVTINQPMVLS